MPTLQSWAPRDAALHARRSALRRAASSILHPAHRAPLPQPRAHGQISPTLLPPSHRGASTFPSPKLFPSPPLLPLPPIPPQVYGEDIAILAGDALLSRSFEYIARATKGVPAERVLRVIADVGKAVGSEGLVAGQVVDLEMEGNGGKGAGLQTLEYIHAHKTGALLEAAVIAGAVLGGAAEADVQKLGRYAQNIGLAFQVSARRAVAVAARLDRSLRCAVRGHWGTSSALRTVARVAGPSLGCISCAPYNCSSGHSEKQGSARSCRRAGARRPEPTSERPVLISSLSPRPPGGR